MDVVDVLASEALSRDMDVDVRGEFVLLATVKFIEGRISFFCVDLGRISSRSTGTPSDTRNARRMRDRIQSGG